MTSGDNSHNQYGIEGRAVSNSGFTLNSAGVRGVTYDGNETNISAGVIGEDSTLGSAVGVVGIGHGSTGVFGFDDGGGNGVQGNSIDGSGVFASSTTGDGIFSSAPTNTLHGRSTIDTVSTSRLLVGGMSTVTSRMRIKNGLLLNSTEWYNSSNQEIAKIDSSGIFLGSLLYGEMQANNIATTVSVPAADTFMQVGSGLSGGLENGFTFQNARELKCLTGGKYMLSWSMSVKTASVGNKEFEGTFMINGVSTGKGTAHAIVSPGGSNRPETISAVAVVTLNVNDLVSLAISDHTDNTDGVVEHASLTLKWAGRSNVTPLSSIVVGSDKWTILGPGDLVSGTDGTQAYPITTAGKITSGGLRSVNSVTTEGPFGVPVIVDTVERTANGAIGSTNFNSTSVAGFYRIGGDLQVTSGSAGGSITVTLSFTNRVGTTSRVAIQSFSATGTGTTSFPSIPIKTASGSISYSVSVTGTPTYWISMICERLY
jgi:hypothetical protein